MRTKKKPEEFKEIGKTFYSKDNVVEILRSKGFDSENISGVVITKFPIGKEKEYYKENVLRVKEILDSIGYKASNGFQIIRGDCP